MKISSLSTWQFVGLMVVILVGVGIVFRYMEKKMNKKTSMEATIPPTPAVTENTAIDTKSGLAARVRYR